MRRGKKLARKLRARIIEWEKMPQEQRGAYRKPGGKPGDYAKRYEGK